VVSTNKKLKLNNKFNLVFKNQFFKNKCAISTALVLILLLLMSMFIFLLISNFLELTIDNFKIDQQLDNFDSKFEIIGINGNLLTIENKFRDNLKINSINIGSIECNFYPYTIDIGRKIINVGSCAKNLSLEQIYQIIFQTQYGVINENEIFGSLDLTQIILEYLSPTPLNSDSILVDYFTVKTGDSIYSKSSIWTTFDSDLLGYWNFDSTNSTHILDLSGNGNHGEIFSDPIISNTNSIRGDNIKFDETNDYVRIPDIDFGVNFTINFWYKLDDNDGTGYQYFYTHGQVGQVNSFNLYIAESDEANSWNDNTRIRLCDSNDLCGSSTSDVIDLVDNQLDLNWHMISIVINQLDGVLVYDNKVLYENDPTRMTDSFNPIGDIYLGARGYDLDSERFYGGYLDEIIIINRSLSQSEINSLYNSNINGYDNIFSNLSSGEHTFQTCEINSNGNYGCLENRTVTLS
jgi:hypothetical protein